MPASRRGRSFRKEAQTHPNTDHPSRLSASPPSQKKGGHANRNAAQFASSRQKKGSFALCLSACLQSSSRKDNVLDPRGRREMRRLYALQASLVGCLTSGTGSVHSSRGRCHSSSQEYALQRRGWKKQLCWGVRGIGVRGRDRDHQCGISSLDDVRVD